MPADTETRILIDTKGMLRMKTAGTDNLKSIVDTILKRLPELKRDYSLRRIGVFGSYSTGRQSSASDVDILVEFERTPDLFEFISLKNRLSTILSKKIDLVTVNSLRKEYAERILNEVEYIQ